LGRQTQSLNKWLPSSQLRSHKVNPVARLKSKRRQRLTNQGPPGLALPHPPRLPRKTRRQKSKALLRLLKMRSSRMSAPRGPERTSEPSSRLRSKRVLRRGSVSEHIANNNIEFDDQTQGAAPLNVSHSQPKMQGNIQIKVEPNEYFETTTASSFKANLSSKTRQPMAK